MLDFTNNKDKLKCNYFSLNKKGLKMPIFVKNMGKQMLTPYTTDKSKNWYSLSRGQSSNIYQNFKCAYPLSQ